MFRSEKDLTDKFINLFENKYGKTVFEEEVLTSKRTKTDLVMNKNQKRYSFEAKLNNIVDVWLQGFRNKKWYEYSYVILPIEKKELIMKKHIKQFKKTNVGIILVSDTSLEFLNQLDDSL